MLKKPPKIHTNHTEIDKMKKSKDCSTEEKIKSCIMKMIIKNKPIDAIENTLSIEYDISNKASNIRYLKELCIEKGREQLSKAPKINNERSPSTVEVEICKWPTKLTKQDKTVRVIGFYHGMHTVPKYTKIELQDILTRAKDLPVLYEKNMNTHLIANRVTLPSRSRSMNDLQLLNDLTSQDMAKLYSLVSDPIFKKHAKGSTFNLVLGFIPDKTDIAIRTKYGNLKDVENLYDNSQEKLTNTRSAYMAGYAAETLNSSRHINEVLLVCGAAHLPRISAIFQTYRSVKEMPPFIERPFTQGRTEAIFATNRYGPIDAPHTFRDRLMKKANKGISLSP